MYICIYECMFACLHVCKYIFVFVAALRATFAISGILKCHTCAAARSNVRMRRWTPLLAAYKVARYSTKQPLFAYLRIYLHIYLRNLPVFGRKMDEIEWGKGKKSNEPLTSPALLRAFPPFILCNFRHTVILLLFVVRLSEVENGDQCCCCCR